MMYEQQMLERARRSHPFMAPPTLTCASSASCFASRTAASTSAASAVKGPAALLTGGVALQALSLSASSLGHARGGEMARPKVYVRCGERCNGVDGTGVDRTGVDRTGVACDNREAAAPPPFPPLGMEAGGGAARGATPRFGPCCARSRSKGSGALNMRERRLRRRRRCAHQSPISTGGSVTSCHQ